MQDPAEIQRKIEEMNRAIEEQTQQIQNLTSTVPELAAALPSIPLLGTVTPSLLASSGLPSTSLTLPHSTPLTSLISPTTIASITAPEVSNFLKIIRNPKTGIFSLCLRSEFEIFKKWKSYLKNKGNHDKKSLDGKPINLAAY